MGTAVSILREELLPLQRPHRKQPGHLKPKVKNRSPEGFSENKTKGESPKDKTEFAGEAKCILIDPKVKDRKLYWKRGLRKGAA